MRLLNTKTAVLRQFNNPADIPLYAILSHVWQKEEQPYRISPIPPNVALPALGPTSLTRFETAARLLLARASSGYGLTHAASTRRAAPSSQRPSTLCTPGTPPLTSVTYGCMMSTTHPSKSDPTSFSQSAWFTRGWTLQELLAPRYVVFLSRKWTLYTKQTLAHRVSRVTDIDEDVLLKTVDLYEVGVARRMSWASATRTTREEDRAYSLMGIFDVNTLTIYGEGSKAFLRLQVEILKLCPD